jgi:hypothetical protein
MVTVHENVRQLCPKLWRQKNWLLCHDNSPFYTSFFTREYFTKNNMTVVPQPPHSPDLVPCYFSMFPRVKIKLKGRHFDTIEVIETESQVVLNTRTKRYFQEPFKKMPEVLGMVHTFGRGLTTLRLMVASRPKVSFFTRLQLQSQKLLIRI